MPAPTATDATGTVDFAIWPNSASIEAMDSRTRARFEARARILKALAHPSRLFMVEALSRGERCVCELTEMVGADMSTVSKHLSVLRAAGIIAMEKRGMQVYYSLKTPCVLRFFDCIGDVIQHSAREQNELVSIR
jgi:DNA-binding transcriptional ArsR family regulator